MRRSVAANSFSRAAALGAAAASVPEGSRRVALGSRSARPPAQLQVLVHPARQVPQRPPQDRVLLVGHPLEQVPVVADDEQRAGERVEQVLHRGEHVGVEVVGGLVEDEHVRLVQQDEQQLRAAALRRR